jgi:hypothetical protein
VKGGNPQLELGENWSRFVAHWIAACFGQFLNVVLPILIEWPSPPAYAFPRWWHVLLFAALTSLLAAIVNANLPVTARELLKSVAFGFAINATSQVLKFT